MVTLPEIDVVIGSRIMGNDCDHVRGSGCDLPLELMLRILVFVLPHIAEAFHLLRAWHPQTVG